MKVVLPNNWLNPGNKYPGTSFLLLSESLAWMGHAKADSCLRRKDESVVRIGDAKS
jgi:hypothetical protein